MTTWSNLSTINRTRGARKKIRKVTLLKDITYQFSYYFLIKSSDNLLSLPLQDVYKIRYIGIVPVGRVKTGVI